MNEPNSQPTIKEEMEKAKYDRWFACGAKLRKKAELVKLLSVMRPGCIQYEAIIDGFGSTHPRP